MEWLRRFLPTLMLASVAVLACVPATLFAEDTGTTLAADEALYDSEEPIADAVGPIQRLAVVSPADMRFEHGDRSLTIRDQVLVSALREASPDVKAYRDGGTLCVANVGIAAIGQVKHLSDCAVNSRFEGEKGLTLAELSPDDADRLRQVCAIWARVRHAAGGDIQCRVSSVGDRLLDVTFDRGSVPAAAALSRTRESPASLALTTE